MVPRIGFGDRRHTEIVDAGNKPQARVVRCAMEYDAIFGGGAVCLTTVSRWPQLKKC